jgi:hypothetical protein
MKGLLILFFLFFFKTNFAQSKYEFRGVWVATIGNIDWPSSGKLSYRSAARVYKLIR